MDAEWRPDASFTWLETGIRISREQMGSLQRGVNIVPVGDCLFDSSDFAGVVVRMEETLDYLWRLYLHRNRPAVHSPVLTRLDRFSRYARRQASTYKLFCELCCCYAGEPSILHGPFRGIPR